MNWQLLWFVLAGLVLGLALSTLWEWFYFRRERMIVRDERITELESQLRVYERREREERMAAPPWTAPGYQSPDALLESERIDEETVVSMPEDDLVESSELFDRHQFPDGEADETEHPLVEDVVLPGAVLAASAVDDAELGENPADVSVMDEASVDEDLADEDRLDEPTGTDVSENLQADVDVAQGEVVEPSESPAPPPESDDEADTTERSTADDSHPLSEIAVAAEEDAGPDGDSSEESGSAASMADDGSASSESDSDESNDDSAQADAPDSQRSDTPVDDEEDGSQESDKALTAAAVAAAGLAAAALATDRSDDDEDTADEPVDALGPPGEAHEEMGENREEEKKENRAVETEEVLLAAAVVEGKRDPEPGETPASAQQTGAVESEPAGEPADQAAESKVWKPEAIRGHPDNLSRVKGVGKVYRRRLYAAGIFTWHQLSQMSADEISEIVHPFVSADVEQWPQRAREVAERNGRVGAQYVGPPPDDLMEIRGIGANAMQRLYKGGIWSFPQLAASSPEELKAIIPVSPSGENIDYERWIEIAAELAQERDQH